MITNIIDQKFFKDAGDNVFCIDIMPMNENSWEGEVKDGWVEISKDEAMIIANPPPSHTDLVESANVKKQEMLSEATLIVDALSDALAGGYIDDGDEIALPKWKKYRYQLLKVDTSKAPDIEWPVKPE